MSDAMPTVVSPNEWQAARDELLVKEKELTRALDAQRRRSTCSRVGGTSDIDYASVL